MKAQFIFYVANQSATRAFYESVLALKPTLDVPGMTEFSLPDGSKIGFMPNAGIKQLLGEKLPDPAQAAGIPRAEIYLMVNDPLSNTSGHLKPVLWKFNRCRRCPGAIPLLIVLIRMGMFWHLRKVGNDAQCFDARYE